MLALRLVGALTTAGVVRRVGLVRQLQVQLTMRSSMRNPTCALRPSQEEKNPVAP